MMLVLHTLIFLWAFWALYVLVMAFYRAHIAGRLVGLNKVLAMPLIAVGIALDVVANLTIATLVFLEPPRHWLVTHRLLHHMKRPENGWRYSLAVYICDHILDPFDPTGNHC